MFNVGDKVIVVNADSVGDYYKNGDIGVVSSIEHKLHGYVTREDGVEMNVYWSEVELYKEPPPVFQVGDRVKFKKSSLETGMIDATEEDVFSVKHTETVAGMPILWLNEMGGFWFYSHFEHVKEEIVSNLEEQEIKWEGSQIDWQVGQEVFCLLRGRGIVSSVEYTKEYPVLVDFKDDEEKQDAYTIDGKLYLHHKNRSLFFSEPEIIAEKSPPKKPFKAAFNKGDTVVAKRKDGQNTVVFYVDEETDLSVASAGYNYTKELWNFYKLSEEIKFN